MESAVQQVLQGKDPGRFVYAPNYWQWYAHHRNHGTLAPELSEAGDQLGMIQLLGLDLFSRNIYCNEREEWFGGLTGLDWQDGVSEQIEHGTDSENLTIRKTYTTPAGTLHEQLRYVWQESTLVQQQFLVTDYEAQANAFECWLKGRRPVFDTARWRQESARIKNGDVICAGEVSSPLKMLHMTMGPVQSVYLLTDEPDLAERWMKIHHQAQLRVMQEMLEAGVPAIMAMDNLDTQFHPPHYVELYSAAFYEEASALCHRYNATFWIHACGRQKMNLQLIASLGVDGLEGVAFPPMGDVTLPEAFALSSDRFLITGGISAIEFETLQSRDAVFAYVQQLFESLRCVRHRFMLSASCNTPITARWEQIRWFRDAWSDCNSAHC